MTSPRRHPPTTIRAAGRPHHLPSSRTASRVSTGGVVCVGHDKSFLDDPGIARVTWSRRSAPPARMPLELRRFSAVMFPPLAYKEVDVPPPWPRRNALACVHSA